jgi:hypothetical protein
MSDKDCFEAPYRVSFARRVLCLQHLGLALKTTVLSAMCYCNVLWEYRTSLHYGT